MEDKIEIIKRWLGDGAINIFGIQFSGKDTLGHSLAGALDANFLGSGDLVRAAAKTDKSAKIRQAAKDSESGILTPTDQFRELIVPHLKDPELADKPLVLSSVGRWIGEEQVVMQALHDGHHDLKAVIVMDISEAEVWRRWNEVKDTRNGGRADDIDESKVRRRLAEFDEKTRPVIAKYNQLGYAFTIDAEQSIEATFQTAIDGLYHKAVQELAEAK